VQIHGNIFQTKTIAIILVKRRSFMKGRNIAMLAAAGAVMTTLGFAPAALADGPRDCNNNSVIWCGAYTKAEFQQKVNQGDGHHTAANLQQIYFGEGRGITMADFMSGNTVDGQVTKDGRVIVNGETVATGAWSTGRNRVPGTWASGSLWASPNSVQFLSNQIDAWVFMKNGQMQWYIIKSCSNTGGGTATPAPSPSPSPSPSPKPSPSPSPSPSASPSPSPSPSVPVTPSPSPTPPASLPDTGPVGAAAGVTGFGAIGYAARSYLRSRKSLVDSLRRK
jgi:hypothetical protein